MGLLMFAAEPKRAATAKAPQNRRLDRSKTLLPKGIGICTSREIRISAPFTGLSAKRY